MVTAARTMFILSGMNTTIIKLQAYEHEEGKNDRDIQMFEKQF